MSTATDQFVTVRIDPTANSLQADIIGPATADQAGVLTAELFQEIEDELAVPTGTINVYSPSGIGAALRPAANAVGAVPGSTAIVILNADDKKLNFSDGVNWYNFDGELT